MYFRSLRGLSNRQHLFYVFVNAYQFTILFPKMNLSIFSKYEEAVHSLNCLQSNAATIQKARAERDANAYRNLIDTEKHLKNLGIEITDLDTLNVIHVSGTKGKGSTCAFVESILRKHGNKTGFYSSPHLVSVNERIRINGFPLDKALFVKYFWEVYNCIKDNLENGETMPPYFMFLTILAFYIFVKEQVKAAIIEVGIGGLYDCTNIIRKPVVVGVTSLDIDHVNILGQTLPEITKHKAGIFKLGVSAFTVPQDKSAMQVLFNKAKEINCPLYLVPPLELYKQNLNLGVPGLVQSVNASLALQLAETWLKKKSCANITEADCLRRISVSDKDSFLIPTASCFSVDEITKEALQTCVWPGRFQTVGKKGITFYLDGAHTSQSMEYCAKWFKDVSIKQKQSLNSSVLKVLMFNCTGGRKAESLLEPLSLLKFDLAIFCPNQIYVTKDKSSDQSNFMVDPEQELQQCLTNKEIWQNLAIVKEKNKKIDTNLSSVHHIETGNECKTQQFCCLSNAIYSLTSRREILHCPLCNQSRHVTEMFTASHIQVLVTGSLHLVGGVLALIENDTQNN